MPLRTPRGAKSRGKVAVVNHVLLDYQACDVDIPKSVKIIGDYAFRMRCDLSAVTIPGGVTESRGSRL